MGEVLRKRLKDEFGTRTIIDVVSGERSKIMEVVTVALNDYGATLGVDRVVFTQPSIYGVDNSAIMDGMNALNAETPNRARAIIACTLDITEDEIAAFDKAGARGVQSLHDFAAGQTGDVT